MQATDAQAAMWSDMYFEAALCANLCSTQEGPRTKPLQYTHQTTLQSVHQSLARN